MKANAAILYHPEGYDTRRGKLMGRHAAGEGFLRGFIQHAGVDCFFACTETQEHFQQFQKYRLQWFHQKHQNLLRQMRLMILFRFAWLALEQKELFQILQPIWILAQHQHFLTNLKDELDHHRR